MTNYNDYWRNEKNVKSLDEFWNREEDNAKRERIYRLVRNIPEKGTVLDAGCGTMHDFPFLTGDGWQYTGSDTSRRMLMYASTIHPEAITCRDDIINTKLGNDTFDLVYSVSVICHLPIESVNAAIGNMMNISRKHLVIYTPYVHELKTITTSPSIDGYIRNRFNFMDLYERISAVGEVIHIERGDDVVAIHALKRGQP